MSEFSLHGHPWPKLLERWALVAEVVATIPLIYRPSQLAKLADGILIVDATDRITFARSTPNLIGRWVEAEELQNRRMSVVLPPTTMIGKLLRESVEEAAALNTSVPFHYNFHAPFLNARVSRTALAVPSPERSHVAILTWHRGMRQFGEGQTPLPNEEGGLFA